MGFYKKTITIPGNVIKSADLLRIPDFIKGKLYLEYKMTDSAFTSPIDDQLWLRKLDGTGSAGILFYNCYYSWAARTLWYNGTESQVTNKGATWGSVYSMAIDFVAGNVKFYYGGTLFGTVTLTGDPNNYRNIVASVSAAKASRILTIEQRLYPSECQYQIAGYKTLIEWIGETTVEDKDQYLYWYK